MAWPEILARIQSRLATTATVFWSPEDIETWYNTGAQLQHRLVFQAAKKAELRQGFRSYENDYLRRFLENYSQPILIGKQDYDLPSDFWRLARVTIALSPPLQCDPVHWNEDWNVRNLPQKMPTQSRPKYCLTPADVPAAAKVRIYVHPGALTVPIQNEVLTIWYYRDLVPVQMAGSPPNVDVDLVDPYHDAPIAWCLYEAMLKRKIDGSPFLTEFQNIVASVLEGPSPEVAGTPGERPT